MGHGSYSYSSRVTRAISSGFDTKSAQEIFKNRSVNSAMNPNGVTLRESRDSTDHPNSIPIILGLDITGSMGSIPHFLVKEGLPHMMDKIIQNGIPDPQVLFLGIGDHECDQAPLQVDQFESGDELLDHWLTELWIEGGGGGNNGESYSLAWFFAGNYVSTDHFEKRNRKGILFTVGDEPVLQTLPSHSQKSIMGEGQYSDMSATEALDKAREKFEVFHLHICQGHQGGRQDVKDGWTQLMGDRVIFVEHREEVAQIIANKVSEIMATQGPIVELTGIPELD